jgi:membrane protease YdiL (CAAX protease family)
MKNMFITFARVMGYFLAIFLILVILVILTQLIFGDQDSLEHRLQILILGIHILIAVGIVNIFMLISGKSQLVKRGWPGYKTGLRWFGMGTLLGLLVSGGVVILIMLTGGGNFSLASDRFSDYLRYILPLLLFLLMASLGEEWIFRGYPITKFSQSFGLIGANVLVSLLFMAGHWGGNGWNLLAASNIFLFSLMNGALRFSPGGIPAAWGFHFAWNSLYVILGAPLTGERFEVPFVQFLSEGPVSLSGGDYGPEGSIAAFVMLIAALIFMYKYLQSRIRTINLK